MTTMPWIQMAKYLKHMKHIWLIQPSLKTVLKTLGVCGKCCLVNVA